MTPLIVRFQVLRYENDDHYARVLVQTADGALFVGDVATEDDELDLVLVPVHVRVAAPDEAPYAIDRVAP